MKKLIVQGSNYISLFDLRVLKGNYCINCSHRYNVKFLRYRRYIDYVAYIKYNRHLDLFYYCDCCKYYIRYRDFKKMNEIKNDSNSGHKNNMELINRYKLPIIKKNDIFIIQD